MLQVASSHKLGQLTQGSADSAGSTRSTGWRDSEGAECEQGSARCKMEAAWKPSFVSQQERLALSGGWIHKEAL